jgi:hypothetical protein
MGLDPIGGSEAGQAAAIYDLLNARSYTPDQDRGTVGTEGVMEGWEIVGVALLALFFGSLVSSKQSISR